MRRQRRDAIAIRSIARLCVGRERLLRKGTQPRMRACLTWAPHLVHRAVPLDVWQQAQLIERHALWPDSRREPLRWSARRRRWIEVLQNTALEWRVDTIRVPAAVLDLPRFAQQCAVEAFRDQTVGTQLLLHFEIACNGRWLVASIPEHRTRAGSRHRVAQTIERRSMQHGKLRSARAQLLSQLRQRAVQPPTRRATERELPLFGIAEDVNRDDRATLLRGCLQRRVVAQAQILAQPDDGSRALSLTHATHAIIHPCHPSTSFPSSIRTKSRTPSTR